jgi:dihydroorotate dehydrogenase (fumarate)
MPDLTTTYLGMTLRSPLVASAGPFTGHLDRLAQIEDAGAGAVVLPSLFEEQIEHETTEIDRLFHLHEESFGEATTFLPRVEDYDSFVDDYLELVEAAKSRLRIPVVASLNGTHIGGWLRYARLLEDAGADAIELNVFAVAADPATSGSALESEQLELVAILAEETSVPVAVKISPFYSSVSAFALALQEAGADGIVMFNRFYLPDLDLETLSVEPRITLSTPDELRLPVRWIGIVRQYLAISVAASTGVHSGDDVAKLLLVGADVTMTTSALLQHGPGYLMTLEDGLCDWMTEHGYESVEEMRGAVSGNTAADPEAFERGNYIGNLASYTSRFLGRGGSLPLQRR